jgi:Ca2+-binding RTX toxin-like protein
VRLALALVVAFVAAPATASASTVFVVRADSCAGDVACEKYGAGTPVPVTTFAADPGEENLVTVTQERDELLIRDSGGPLTAKAPCVAVGAGNARCPITRGRPGIRGVSLALGDGDDTAVVGGTRVEATISGGPGDDELIGGAENDQIDGGRGDDLLSGGGGFDELVYSSRSAPVVVDLGSGGGEHGEADVVSGFESLVGGAGGDVLRGTGRDDVIHGGAGADVIAGRGGDDDLFGGAGADRLSGGPGRDRLEGGAGPDRMDAGGGNDRIRARGGGRDRVDCGCGRDRARTDRSDTRRRCER